MSKRTHEHFIPVWEVAVNLGVPRRWLETEAREGRIPCLRAGRSYVANLDEVREALDQRARQRCTEQAGGAK